jgi:cytochrome c-550 PedF
MLFQTGSFVHRTFTIVGWQLFEFGASARGTAIAEMGRTVRFASRMNGDIEMNQSTRTPIRCGVGPRRGRLGRVAVGVGSCAIAFFAAGLAIAHGDVTPQAVDTASLPKLGEGWRDENPFRASDAAVKVGTSAFNQNCARCHGLEAISGGIAPDLRKLDNECATMKDAEKKAACVKDNDVYFLTTVRHGRSRNGAVYMPPFEGTFDQEAIWAIKAYLESRREKPL